MNQLVAVGCLTAYGNPPFTRNLTNDGSLAESAIRTHKHLHGVVLVAAEYLGHLGTVGLPCNTRRGAIDILRGTLHHVVVAGIRGTQRETHVLDSRTRAEGDTARDDTACLTEAHVVEGVLQRVAAVYLNLVLVVVAWLYGVVLVGVEFRCAIGSMDAHKLAAAVDIAARKDVGAVFRTYLVGSPRQAHCSIVRALRGLEVLQLRAGEQTGIDGIALKAILVVDQRQAHLVLIACGDVGQVGVDKRQRGTCRRLGIAGDAAILGPVAFLGGLAQNLEVDGSGLGRHTGILPGELHLVSNGGVLLQGVDAHVGSRAHTVGNAVTQLVEHGIVGAAQHT